MSIESLRSYLRFQINNLDEAALNKIAEIVDKTLAEDMDKGGSLTDILSDAQKEELENRYQEYLNGDVESYSLEEIKSKLLNRNNS